MIQHEPWFKRSNSREAEDAVERLKRGDDSALRDIWVLGQRGGLRTLEPEFLMKALAHRHGGKDFSWILALDRAFEGDLNNRPLPFEGNPPRFHNGYRVVENMRDVSSHLQNKQDFDIGSWMQFPWEGAPYAKMYIPFNILQRIWDHADGTMGDLDREWDIFLKLNPQYAYFTPKGFS